MTQKTVDEKGHDDDDDDSMCSLRDSFRIQRLDRVLL
jgi:hypothetical protein